MVVRKQEESCGRQGSGVEERRRGAHEVEAGKQLVELDGAGLAIDLTHRQAHGDAHEEGLGQFEASSGVCRK